MTRPRLSPLLLSTVLVLGATPAMAETYVISDPAEDLELNDGDSLINNSGSILYEDGIELVPGIVGLNDHAVVVTGDGGFVQNHGVITSDDYGGVFVDGALGEFLNSGVIATSGNAVEIHGDLTSFQNYSGALSFPAPGIASKDGFGVLVRGDLGSFQNGPIDESYSFGQIIGEKGGLVVDGDLGEFTNDGAIVGVGSDSSNNDIVAGVWVGVQTTGTFANTGAILGRDAGAYFLDDVHSFKNHAGGTLTSSEGYGAYFDGGLSDFENAGIISGSSVGVRVAELEGRFINSGEILGADGLILSSGHAVIENSGLIEGTTGKAIGFTDDYNTLILKTGGRFAGDVDFAGGVNSTFDFAEYTGSIVVDVTLDSLAQGNVVAGDNLYFQSPDQVVITSKQFVRQSPVAVAGLVGQISDLLQAPVAAAADEVAATTMAYAPPTPASAAEQAASDVLRPQGGGGYDAWGTVLGGMVSQPGGEADLASVYGGLVAGAHAAVSPDTTLGLLGGYARSTVSVGGSQTITADTGILGLYGSTMLDTTAIRFVLLAGLSANASAREIAVGAETEVASAGFGGWFIAPEVSASLPLASLASADIGLRGHIGFIGGGFAGYTEDGSSADLSVSAQNFAILTSGLDLTAAQVLGTNDAGNVTATAAIGVFTQTSLGGSDITVSLPDLGGIDLGSVTQATGTTYGVKLGGEIAVPMSAGLLLTAGAQAQARNDGLLSAGANLKLSGSF